MLTRAMPVTLAFVFAIPALALEPASQPASAIVGWRTDGTGRYPGATPPTKWSTTDNVAWKANLGAWSNATPVLCGDRIFVCAEPTKLICLSAKDGAKLWEADQSYEAAGISEGRPNTQGVNGYSSPTPTTDGKFVYAVFGNGLAAAYDMQGKRQWVRLVEKPTRDWGQSCSPLLVADKLVVYINSTHALNVKDGGTAWQLQPDKGAGRKQSEKPWGSPISLKIGGVDLVATPEGQLVRAADGTVLADKLGELKYNCPLAQDGVLYYISNTAAAYELPASVPDNGPVALTKKWERKLKGDRYYASPLLVDGRIYAVTRGQDLTVISAADGKTIYEQKLPFDGGGTNGLYSSPTFAGGKVFITSDPGETIVLNTTDKFDEVGRNPLETCRACPVFDGPRAYIRAGKSLYCIQQKQ